MTGRRLRFGSAILFGLLALLGVTLVLPTASLGDLVAVFPPHLEIITIPFDDYAAFSFPANVDVNIYVNVTSGGRVDIYLMSASWFNLYSDPNGSTFFVHRTYSEDDVLTYNRTITDRSVTIVVIDNTALASGGAFPTGEVTVEFRVRVPPAPSPPPPPPPTPIDWNVVIFACFVPVLILGLGMFLILRGALRKKAKEKRAALLAAQQQAALIRAYQGPPGTLYPVGPPPPKPVVPSRPPPPPPPPPP